MKATYTGNPGYCFPGINGGAPLEPGKSYDVADLATVGEDFVKSAKTTTAAPADTDKEG